MSNEVFVLDTNENDDAMHEDLIPKIIYTTRENIKCDKMMGKFVLNICPTRKEYEKILEKKESFFKKDVLLIMYNMNDQYFLYLWMLCELYETGGVGFNNNIFNINEIKPILQKNIPFNFIIDTNLYGVITPLICVVPKCILILQMIISFINNKSYLYIKNPLDDMYNVFINNFFVNNTMNNKIQKDTNKGVLLDELHMTLNIGTNNIKYKTIDLYDFPHFNYKIKLNINPYDDKFTYQINENKLFICRLNGHDWGYEHKIHITNMLNVPIETYFNINFKRNIIQCPITIGSNEKGNENKIIKLPNFDVYNDINYDMNLYFDFKLLRTIYSDSFSFYFNNELKQLEIQRIDKNHGWNHSHSVLIINKIDETNNYILEFGRSNNHQKNIKFYDFIISNKTDDIFKLEYAKYFDYLHFAINKTTELNNKNSSNTNLIVNRINSDKKGWGHNHKVNIINVQTNDKQTEDKHTDDKQTEDKQIENKNIKYEKILLPIVRNTNIQMIPKIIHFTHYKYPPMIVFERWKQLNPCYGMTFSLDGDCRIFLKKYFGDYFVNLFNSIKKGMYKADLWRLCYLYIYGGIYTDVDIVPLISINKLLELNCNFYSCLSIVHGSIFQAVIMTLPRNPLILIFIWSFVHNMAYTKRAGPTIDMYNCLKEILCVPSIREAMKYNMDEVFFNMPIGASNSDTKIINMRYIPDELIKNNEITIEMLEHNYEDRFDCKIENNCIIVKRIDKRMGWKHNHIMRLTIKFSQLVYLFQEKRPKGKSTNECYVEHDNEKIFMSRDINYKKKNGGWK